MGEEEEDPQKLKKIAAAVYDYENDPRWADYWSNILIPPHMASGSDIVDHFKRKFYCRYIDPGLVVEPMTISSSSQPARSSAPQSSSSSLSSSASNNQPRQRNSGAASRTSGTSSTPTSSSTSLRWNRQTIQFSVNAWVPYIHLSDLNLEHFLFKICTMISVRESFNCLLPSSYKFKCFNCSIW